MDKIKSSPLRMKEQGLVKVIFDNKDTDESMHDGIVARGGAHCQGYRIHTEYTRIHKAQCIPIANHRIQEYISEYIRIHQNTVF